ncbi:MAG: aminoacyl-tRNA deacylase [Anaerolineales bacterium]|nr:aminoacyl-tRNA deacylase [Anaerolineales bacterium]MCB8954318.1 aminoacyl-tRNA deacylase [Ardenticatenales bacterium]
MEKTLAMKVLEGRKVPYEVLTYPETERDARMIAGMFGVPANHVFKTLVVPRPKGKPLLVLVPADCQLDLKKLARAVGEKKLKMAAHKEAEALTGLQVGGISPLALLNKGFMVLLDASAAELPFVYVSAGKKGINLKVPTAALRQITAARLVDVATPEDAPTVAN